MSELDKVVAALVATEVAKQLGERNSLPNVKRADVTAEQWRDIIALEVWELLPKAPKPYYDDDGVAYEYLYQKYYHSERGFEVNADIISDAVHNVGAPAKFRSTHIDLLRNRRFEFLKGGFNIYNNSKDVYRKGRCLVK